MPCQIRILFSLPSQHFILQSLVKMCVSLVIQERAAAAVSVAANLPFAPMLSPPQFFADTVIKFSSRLMHVLKDQCSLKELCGNLVNVGSPARTEKIFVRLVLPTCIRLGSGRSGKFTTRASTFWQSSESPERNCIHNRGPVYSSRFLEQNEHCLIQTSYKIEKATEEEFQTF